MTWRNIVCRRDMKEVVDCFEVKPHKCWVKDGKIFIAIQDDDNYWKNKSVLQEWYFDYEKFKKLGYYLNCYNYGVYVAEKKVFQDNQFKLNQYLEKLV